jgi:hypothetical protein
LRDGLARQSDSLAPPVIDPTGELRHVSRQPKNNRRTGSYMPRFPIT